ncbi:MAG: ThiF family adenylyltransferase [Planctomycetota bacterium]|jgi:adenylyltransferase/sulfurtransferase|nr:ThiF family adenylyltransferase [Planctomycetota bacterium]MDP6763712.1 ThiF family adenylyltransferase [Planctomycetota bacterium]MDP6990147.1 ThiF family adenylyltransferase [Planctomycetota bacterium]
MNDQARPSRRFERQVRFAPLGTQGQERLEQARVLLVGCGALGGVLAQELARSGVGRLVLVDRDVVEETNLPRQVLFEDRHAREGTLKVEAAHETLARIGGPTRLELHAEHLDPDNVEDLAEGCDLVLDGTDNLGTRYLLNDYCVEQGVPWIYGGVVGSGGLVLPILPGTGPCLRCLFPEPPPTGSLPTCDTAGVLLPAVAAVASVQAGHALRILARDPDGEPPPTPLVEIDVWSGEARSLRVARQPACPCCAERDFPHLHSPPGRRATILCGRNAVQVRGRKPAPDLERVAAALEGVAESVRFAGPILRFTVDAHTLTLFRDGRALIEGTDEIDRALALYDRYVGS